MKLMEVKKNSADQCLVYEYWRLDVLLTECSHIFVRNKFGNVSAEEGLSLNGNIEAMASFA